MEWKIRLKRISKWVSIGLIGLLLFLTSLFALLQTGPGKEQIARLVAGALTKEGKARVEISRPRGFIPFRFQLDRVAVSDSAGQWLTIEGIAVRLSPSSLLRGHLFVRNLSATRIHLHRLPHNKQVKKRPSKGLGSQLLALSQLTIDHLDIEHVALGELVLGRPANFSVTAALMAPSPDGGRVTSLRIEGRDRVATRVAITAAVRGPEPVLAINAQAREPKGGFLGSALGIQGPIMADLIGTGLLGDWKGNLRVEAGNLGLLQTEVGLKVQEHIKLTAQGTHSLPATPVRSAFAALLGPEMRFELAARLLKTKTLTLDHLTVSAGNLRGRLEGHLDLTKQLVDGRFTLNCDDLTSLATLVNLSGRGRLSAEGHLAGPILRPRAAVTLKLEDVEVDRLRARSFEGDFHLELSNLSMSPLEGLSLNGSGTLEGVSVQGAGPLPQTGCMWRLVAEGSVKKTIHLSQLKLAGDELTLELSGRIDTAGPGGTLDGVLEVRDLRQFSSLLGYDVPGGTRLKVALEGDTVSQSLSAHIQGKMNFFDRIPPFFAPLAGTEASYRAEFALIGGKELIVSQLSLDTVVGKVSSAGSLDLKALALNASFTLEAPQLDLLSAGFRDGIGGTLRVNGVIKGPLKKLSVDAEAVGRDLLFKDTHLKELVARLDTDELSPKSRGHLTLELHHKEDKIVGTTRYALDGSRLALSLISVKSPGTELTGNMILDTERRLVEGALKGTCEDLTLLSPLLNERIWGSAEIDIRFEAPKASQQAIFELKGKNVASRFGRVGDLELRGGLKDLLSLPRGTAELKVKDVRLHDLTFSSLHLSAQGTAQEVTFTGGISGHYRNPFEIETSGLFAAMSGGQMLKLERFQARYGPLPLTLAKPVTIERSPNGLSIKEFLLDVADGLIKVSGVLGQTTQTLNFQFKDLPMGALQFSQAPWLTGRATGAVHFSGEKGVNRGSMTIRLEGVGLHDAKFQDLPRATVGARAKLDQGRLHGEFSLQGLTAEPFEASLDIPVNLSLSPLAWSLPTQGLLRGNLSGELDLARITALIGLLDQSLEGHMEVSLTLAGTVSAPQIKGQANIKKGGYENAKSGTILKDIELYVTAPALRVQIEHARATDGGNGIISAKGWFDLIPSQGFPFSTKLILDQAALLRHDNASATVDGKLTLDGSLAQSMLTGQVTVKSAELRIPRHLPPEITQLEVIEIRKIGQTTNGPPALTHPPRHVMKLDVQVLMPGQVYVRGRGLDSEWRGEVRMSGKSTETAISGTLAIVRGYFNFLGKRFALKSGAITFDGGIPPAPHMNLLAEARTKDMTAQLQLSGPIARPEVALSSEPVLPSDEIISRLLFGRGVANISPVQALRLAQAVNTMAGGGAFDFLGRTRRFLGIDQLDVKQAGEDLRETTITAGKYVGEKVYVEVERGIGSQSGKASVELELTPNISVETEVGANAEGGVGLNWKWDY
jgi:translocation and assembly module TamB